MTLMVMARWYGHLIDVRGAFLQGTFEPGEQIHMEIPQGFEKHCPKNVVLLLLRTIYGLKNSAMAWWRKMLSAFCKMDCKRSKADPCLHFKWTAGFGLTMWLSHVDDCCIAGKKEGASQAKDEMQTHFECDDIGELKECVGCKINHKPHRGHLRATQPVLLQSFEDEFNLPKGKAPTLPAAAIG